MVWDTSDEGFKALKNAYFNNSAIALFASENAPKRSGGNLRRRRTRRARKRAREGNGLDADFVVTSFSRQEPLEEALTVSVTCKPTLVTRAPIWKDGGS